MSIYLSLSRRLAVLICTMLLAWAPLAAAGGDSPAGHGIAVLLPYGPGASGVDLIATDMRAQLMAQGYNPADIFLEYLDLERNPDPLYRQNERRLLLDKFARRRIDVIVTVLQPALDYLLRDAPDLLPDATVITVLGSLKPGLAPGAHRMFVMNGAFNYRATLEQAMALFPATRHVEVVVGASPTEGQELADVRAALQPWAGRLSIADTHALSIEQVGARLAGLPKDAIVLGVALRRDGSGRNFNRLDALRQVAPASRAPFFVFYDLGVGERNFLGGNVFSIRDEARRVAQLAYQLATGARAAPAGVTLWQPVQVSLYDWPLLQRLGADPGRLPPDTRFINRPVPIWVQYRNEVAATLLAFLALLAMLAALWWQVQRKSQAEAALARHQQQLEQQVAERTAALSIALEQAQDASRAKSHFVSNVSHELRTPMNAIIGMSALALELPLEAKARNYIAKVQRAAENLLGIINNILDFSRVEAGKVTLEALPFRLADVMDNLATMIGQPAASKGVALRFQVAPEIPAGLVGDALRLGQVLTNLGNNAVKFTEHGQIVVEVAQLGRSEAGVELRFSVADTGIGMQPEQCARLFQAFSQADESITRKYGGSGLGLAICKELAGLLGGRIWVESVPGQGTVFHFVCTFGVAAALPPAQARHEPRSLAAARLAGAHVLLVDDNEMNQELAQDLLSKAGITVTLAGNGQQALELLAHGGPFDGVLMDCQMPVMDGYTATRAIRGQPQWRDLPVLAMTANAMSDDRARALEAGMNDHIAKPLNVQQMFATMAQWITPAHPAAPPAAAPEPAADTAEFAGLPGLDTQAALRTMGGSAAMYRKMLRRFRGEQAGFGTAFGAARAAGDAVTARRIAHTLRGAAGTIGARHVQAAAAALEQACRDGAPAAGVERLLAQVEAELAPLLAGLAPLDLEPAAAAPQAQLDQAALQAALASLRGMLGDNDAAALQLAARLARDTQGTPAEAPLRAIAAAVEEYDFDLALQALHGMAPAVS